MKSILHRGFAAALVLVVAVGGALAGDCTGFVTGVRPIAHYNHAAGTGFLAVRAGPGSGYRQIGELYLGDEISVWDRQGKWYYVYCMSGQCLTPLWGSPEPQGWVYGTYLRIGGVCP